MRITTITLIADCQCHHPKKFHRWEVRLPARLLVTYFDVAFVSCPYASLNVDSKRPLCLFWGDRADLGCAVLTGNMAGKRAHCTRKGEFVKAVFASDRSQRKWENSWAKNHSSAFCFPCPCLTMYNQQHWEKQRETSLLLKLYNQNCWRGVCCFFFSSQSLVPLGCLRCPQSAFWFSKNLILRSKQTTTLRFYDSMGSLWCNPMQGGSEFPNVVPMGFMAPKVSSLGACWAFQKLGGDHFRAGLVVNWFHSNEKDFDGCKNGQTLEDYWGL